VVRKILEKMAKMKAEAVARRARQAEEKRRAAEAARQAARRARMKAFLARRRARLRRLALLRAKRARATSLERQRAARIEEANLRRDMARERQEREQAEVDEAARVNLEKMTAYAKDERKRDPLIAVEFVKMAKLGGELAFETAALDGPQQAVSPELLSLRVHRAYNWPRPLGGESPQRAAWRAAVKGFRVLFKELSALGRAGFYRDDPDAGDRADEMLPTDEQDEAQNKLAEWEHRGPLPSEGTVGGARRISRGQARLLLTQALEVLLAAAVDTTAYYRYTHFPGSLGFNRTSHVLVDDAHWRAAQPRVALGSDDMTDPAVVEMHFLCHQLIGFEDPLGRECDWIDWETGHAIMAPREVEVDLGNGKSRRMVKMMPLEAASLRDCQRMCMESSQCVVGFFVDDDLDYQGECWLSTKKAAPGGNRACETGCTAFEKRLVDPGNRPFDLEIVFERLAKEIPEAVERLVARAAGGMEFDGDRWTGGPPRPSGACRRRSPENAAICVERDFAPGDAAAPLCSAAPCPRAPPPPPRWTPHGGTLGGRKQWVRDPVLTPEQHLAESAHPELPPDTPIYYNVHPGLYHSLSEARQWGGGQGQPSDAPPGSGAQVEEFAGNSVQPQA
jgi:hypothetical protein